MSDVMKRQVMQLFSHKFTEQAGKLLKNKTRTLGFLGFVQGKFAEVGTQKGLAAFSTSLRMIKLAVAGKYKALPWRTLLSLVAAFLYLASPIDVIPDFIPVLGLVDDLFLLGFIFRLAAHDFEKFKAWEDQEQLRLKEIRS